MRSFCSWDSMGGDSLKKGSLIVLYPATHSASWPGLSRPSRFLEYRLATRIGMPGTRPGMTTSNSKAQLLPIRPRIARRPAASLDAGDEVGNRLVEQRRLLLVH